MNDFKEIANQLAVHYCFDFGEHFSTVSYSTIEKIIAFKFDLNEPNEKYSFSDWEDLIDFISEEWINDITYELYIEKNGDYFPLKIAIGTRIQEIINSDNLDMRVIVAEQIENYLNFQVSVMNQLSY